MTKIAAYWAMSSVGGAMPPPTISIGGATHGCRKGFRSGGAIARSRGLEAVVHT